MNRFLGATLLLLSIVGGSTASAENAYRRHVNFEWEPIEGAKSYELEIKQEGASGKTYNFKEKSSLWEGRLTPGPYVIRVRALDYRGVPGEWSEPSPFAVNLESAKPLSPPLNASIAAKDPKETEVEFRWNPVPGASEYGFELQSKDGSFKHEVSLRETRLKLRLPVAKSYVWKVNASDANKVQSDAHAVSEFSMIGPALATPEIDRPENDFVREVKWTPSPHATGYDVIVTRINPKDKKWYKVKSFNSLGSTSIPFTAEYGGGIYRVQVRARGEQRLPSKVRSAQFRVRGGDRSPAAEFTHEVRKSIDRVNGWYAIASYLVTQIDYYSTDFDGLNGLRTNFPAVGGTARVGLGHFRELSSWGFLGVLDVSGFLDKEGKPLTAVSTEANAVWKTPIGSRGEFRSQTGLFYKEHQVALPVMSTSGEVSVDAYENAAVLGPHLGAEYWHSLTPKVGLQGHAHFYYSVLKLKTPNDQAIEPTLSSQLGVMASYRFTPRLTGLVGYSRREDHLRYKSKSTNTNNSGRINEAKVEGNYLSFFAEYSF